MRARFLHFILIAAVAFITQPLAVVAGMGSSMPCCAVPVAASTAPMSPASCPSCDEHAAPAKNSQSSKDGADSSQSCCAYCIPVFFVSESPLQASAIPTGLGDATPYAATCTVRDVQPLLPPPKVA